MYHQNAQEDRPNHNCTWNKCHHFFTTLYQTASSSMGNTNFAVNNHRFTDLCDLIVTSFPTYSLGLSVLNV